MAEIPAGADVDGRAERSEGRKTGGRPPTPDPGNAGAGSPSRRYSCVKGQPRDARGAVLLRTASPRILPGPQTGRPAGSAPSRACHTYACEKRGGEWLVVNHRSSVTPAENGAVARSARGERHVRTVHGLATRSSPGSRLKGTGACRSPLGEAAPGADDPPSVPRWTPASRGTLRPLTNDASRRWWVRLSGRGVRSGCASARRTPWSSAGGYGLRRMGTHDLHTTCTTCTTCTTRRY